jgi:5-methylcytosine-specific restriction endonuclease McrA
VSRSWAGGSTTAWRKVRALVLARDGGQCMIQLSGCTGRATHCDHIVAKSQEQLQANYDLRSYL